MSKKLVIIEFATNNNELTSIKLFSFFLFKGLHPHISFDIINLSNINTCKRIYKHNALNLFENIKTICKFL